jgi:hypothetical protein
MFKKFGAKINFDKYTREDLENYRNLLRTKLNQTETSANFNDLLTNETYQRDKFMLSVLNSRIKEMLGESIEIMERAVSRAQQQAAGIALAAQRGGKKPTGKGASAAMSKMSTAELEKFAKTKHKGLPKHKKADESVKPDFLDVDKDGDKKEPFKKAVKDSKKNVKMAEVTMPADTNKPAINRIRAVKGATAAAKTATVKRASDVDASKIPAVTRKAKQDSVEEAAKPSAGMTAKQKSAVVKKARAGKDIGKPGKGFEKVEKAAAKGGAKNPKAVAAAAMWKNQAKKIKESVDHLIMENEEEKAQIISAGIDMVQDFTSWMQRIGSYQTKSMLEMGDDIRAEFGQAKADEFKAALSPALAEAMTTLTSVREQLTTAIAVLTGEAQPHEPMGADALDDMPDDLTAEPDAMNLPPEDEFGASDAAAGGAEVTGRARRESREFARMSRLQESHDIMVKLAK